jgi:hypothetical protein
MADPQLRLLTSVASLGVSVVVILINGGGVGEPALKSLPGAVLEAFYPGQMGGDAIVSTLLGDSPPAGRLPLTVYPPAFVETRKLQDLDLRSHQGVTYR